MHKIIKEFIETDKSFIAILIEGLDPSQPVEVAFPIIIKQINKRNLPAELYQQIDEAIEYGHPDEEVFLLFISYLIVFYTLQGMAAKSDSVYQISTSIDITKYRTEIEAYYYQNCAFYFNGKNEIKKRDELNLLSVSKMPKACPRYYKFLANTGQLLAIDGRLMLLSKEDLGLLTTFAETGFPALSSLLNNSIYIVDMDLTEKYYSKMVIKFADDFLPTKNMEDFLISIYKGDLEEKENLGNSINYCLRYYKSIKNGDLELAKKNIVNIEPEFVGGFSSFIFYHHAFVTGRYEIIEKIINKIENQNYHYLLDFFIARYFLVKNKKDLARYYYSQLLKNCEKFNALGRLKFEMQFAVELSAISFFELTQPIQNAITMDISKATPETIISPNVIIQGLHRVIGNSNSIMEIKKKIKSFAGIQRPILVIGETGAGKEIVARAIHEESIYNDKPFLAINCGALTDTLLQSELFGYEAGAFTGAVNVHKGIFEAAEDGVVFLDEFGEMSHKLQVSLLRVLENNEILRVGGTKVRQIKCRIIAATNANIEDLILKKLFREDLYHRLKQFSVSIPPLRDRQVDIPELIHYFLNQQNNEQMQVFSNELITKFQAYHWPGNIRELKNEIERIKILCGYKPVIEMDDIEIEWLKKGLKNNVKDKIKSVATGSRIANIDDQEMHQRIINKKLTFADKRSQQMLLLFQKYKQLTRGQIAEALQISSLTATKDLQRLCAEGVLIKKMPTLSPRSHYFEII